MMYCFGIFNVYSDAYGGLLLEGISRAGTDASQAALVPILGQDLISRYNFSQKFGDLCRVL